MSKKRRMFDIDLPEDDLEPQAVVEAGNARRGPMAAAVRENAESLRGRAEQEQEIRAENDRLAHEFVRLKKQGLITDLVPVEAISTDKLARDRAMAGEDDLDDLKLSLAEIGLSNPIQLEHLGEGRYELIQGFRRLSAWKALLVETGDSERWGRIPAGIVAIGQPLEELYRRMVDEDISFAEMAELARRYAADPATSVEDVDSAVGLLFRSAAKQKRSYIRAFAQLLDRIGEDLTHPQAMPRGLGLALRKRLDEVPGVEAALRSALRSLPSVRTPDQELALLQRYAGGASDQVGREKSRGGAVERPARTTFRVERPGGSARCVASDGRLEVRLGTDFSAKDRRVLEAAVAELLATLGE